MEEDGNPRSAPPRNAAHRSAPQDNATQRFWSDVWSMLKWALAAAALTLVFAGVLDALDLLL